MSRFQVPTIRERGHVAKAMAAVQVYKPKHGEAFGYVICPRCGTVGLRYKIQSSGISQGRCGCGLTWCQ